MGIRKLLFLIICCLVAIAINGCATAPTATVEHHVHTIDSDSIQTVVDDPSGSKSPLSRGDIAILTTKEKIRISTRNVDWVRMVVVDVNTSKVKGRVEYVSGDVGEEYEDVAGIIAEVQFDNIQKIEVWKTKKAKKAPLPPFPFKEMMTGTTIIIVSILITGLILF